MNIAYFGGDWFLSCLQAWQLANHEITHIFTHGEQHYNKQLRNWGSTHNVTIHTAKPTHIDMQQLQNDAVDCLFCVEYPWLIPTKHFAFKSMNVHPSLLPNGKGPTPISWIIHSKKEYSGVTFHKLSSEFDTGDVIYQEPIEVSPHDTLDTFLGKLELEIPRMLAHILINFEHQYANAVAQGVGTVWPKMELSDRSINWNSCCADIRQQIKAAGQFGITVTIDKQIYLVKHMQCVEHRHRLAAGQVFKEDIQHFYITNSNGLCVIDKSAILESKPIQ